MNKTTTELFYRKLKNENPNPKGELNYINSYTLLVAVVLSAQATDVSVNKATKNLFKIAQWRPQAAPRGAKDVPRGVRESPECIRRGTGSFKASPDIR